MAELTSIQVELDAEFDSEANGDIFELDLRSKNGTSFPNAGFFKFLGKVFGVWIRYLI